MKIKKLFLFFSVLMCCASCVFVQYNSLFCKTTINISENEYVEIQFNSNDSFAVITKVDYHINRSVESELFLYIPKVLNADNELTYVNRIGCNGYTVNCAILEFSIYIDEKFILVEKVVLNIFYGVNAYDHYNTQVCTGAPGCRCDQSYFLRNSKGVDYANKNFIELIVNERYY